MINYHLFFFTDWIPLPNIKNKAGLGFIGFTCLNIMVNFSVMVKEVYNASRRERRKKIYDKKLTEMNHKINEKFKAPYMKRYVMRAIKEKKPLDQVIKEAKERRTEFFIDYVPGYLKRIEKPKPVETSYVDAIYKDLLFQRRIDAKINAYEERVKKEKEDERKYQERIRYMD